MEIKNVSKDYAIYSMVKGTGLENLFFGGMNKEIPEEEIKDKIQKEETKDVPINKTFKILMMNNAADDDYYLSKPKRRDYDSDCNDDSGEEFWYDNAVSNWKEKKTNNIFEFPIGIVNEDIDKKQLKDLSKFYKKINPDTPMCNFFIEEIKEIDFPTYYKIFEKNYVMLMKYEDDKRKEETKKRIREEENMLQLEKKKIEDKLNNLRNQT